MIYLFKEHIKIESLLIELEELDFSADEKMHLARLIDSSLHLTILDEILSNLNDEDKRLFLKKLHENSQKEELINFLNSKIEKIDQKIRSIADQLIIQMHKDIKEAKKLR